MIILPYKLGSKSAKLLATALGLRRVRPNGNFRNNYHHTVLNWGCSSFDNVTFPYSTVINPPDKVYNASNKLKALDIMGQHSVPVPPFTDNTLEAEDWLEDGNTVVRRAILRGHSGQGISLHNPDDGDALVRFSDAPLYTLYIKKSHEFRVHVMKDKCGGYNCIDVQMKRKRQETPNEEVNYQVRSHHTGWVYCREGFENNPIMMNTAVNAIIALGLDFGAVDIIYNKHNNQYTVLEVNTACGLEGSSVDIYANAIKECF